MWVRVIAVFKFVKALLLLAVVLGAFQLVHPGVAENARRWIEGLALSVDRRWAHHALASITRLPPDRVGIIAVGAFLYAALFTIEGVGLWGERRWGEYLTVIATTSFVPFEIYEIAHKGSAPRILALIINVAAVVYLIYRLRHDKRHARS
ncbi:MAG: DUF2127 domain-containing protein [Gemmatimonadales bacterium]